MRRGLAGGDKQAGGGPERGHEAAAQDHGGGELEHLSPDAAGPHPDRPGHGEQGHQDRLSPDSGG